MRGGGAQKKPTGHTRAHDRHARVQKEAPGGMGGDDEASQLAEAAGLPWEERFKHSFWKARVAAYECVGREAAISEDVQSSNCLRAFGACTTR